MIFDSLTSLQIQDLYRGWQYARENPGALVILYESELWLHGYNLANSVLGPVAAHVSCN